MTILILVLLLKLETVALRVLSKKLLMLLIKFKISLKLSVEKILKKESTVKI